MQTKEMAQHNRGFSVVEILIATSIISLSVISIATVYGNLVSLSVRNTAKVQATFLLDEGVEAIKTMRGEKWSNIASSTPGTSYYFTWSTNKWRATTTPALIDGVFYRTFMVSPVYRDASTFNILTNTSGTLDPGTKKVDITVSWLENNATTTRTVSTYVFNLYE
jgi:type II secretory pathway pseudopilin PulG